ncbi:PAS domain S-box protein [Microcoleus sp. FACHB-831]|uniref:PAS domain S-box protein n=1 Tax=Microcoleus sp. FACHB-831 TaxID=2692827 RepID=UPI001689B96E|nr:PAS domain S-box protein [Microcoleus sp. FACHB-831]MBD1924384.1 PAS domain S-box protein [Microcoleus sp. FACHB-831]
MKRSIMGKFINNWEGESKKRVNLSLTETAWNTLDEFAKTKGLSRSEIVELYARSLEAETKEPFAQEKECVVQVADEQKEGRELCLAIAQLPNGENDLLAIIDAVPVLVAYIDAQQRYRFNNKAFQDWFGSTPSQFYGKHLEEVVGKTAYESVRPYIEAALAGQEVTYESSVTYKKGETRYIRATYVPRFAEDGVVEGFVALVKDISDRVFVQDELRKSEERYRSLVEASAQIIWDTKAEGEIVTPQPGWSEFTGQSYDELKGWGWLNAVHPDDRTHTAQAWSAALSDRTFYQVEHRLRRKDGEYRYMSVRGVPVLEPDGSIREWVGVHTDITSTKQVEEELQETNQTLQALIQACPLAITVFALDGKVKMWNPAAEKIFGWTEREALSTFIPCVPEDKRDEFLAHLDAIRKGQILTGVEARRQKKNGESIDISLWAAPLRDAKGNISCMSILADISERKQAETEREAAREQISKILESITDGFLAFDREWRFTYLNQEGARTLGRSPAELVGKNLWQEFPELSSTSFGKLYQQAVASRVVQELEDYYPPFEAWFAVRAYPSEAGLSLYFRNVNDRKQAEEILRQSEERLRLALDAGKAGVWDWDISGDRINWSERIYEFHGLTPGTFSGKLEDYAYLVYPEDRHRVAETIQKAIEEKSPFLLEIRIVQPSGAVRWISANGRAIYDANGKAVRMLGATIDITEQKAVEEDREQLLVREQTARAQAEVAQRQLTAIFETSPIGIGFLDSEQRFVAINEALAEINGLSREQHLGNAIPEIFGESDPELVEVFHNLYATGTPFISPNLAVNVPGRDDRSPGYYYVYYLPTLNQNNSVEGVLVYVVDVTERVLLEARSRFLAESSALLASSLDYQTTLERVAHLAVPHLADWCVVDILDEDGSLQRLATAHIDPAKVEWASELQQRYPTNLNAPQGVGNVLRTGQPEYYPEILDSQIVASARDAEHLKILRNVGFKSVMIVPLRVRGRILGAISFVSAESGRRYNSDDLNNALELACRAAVAVDNARLYQIAQRDRAQAEAANRMKDEFLATLSHELRTPLNAMLGWTQMLRARKLNEATAAKALETVDRNARSLSRLIEDLLDVSRIITGKLRLNMRPVELSGAVEAAIDAVRPAAEAKEIQLEFLLDPLSGTVSGDPDRLQQIVWNLLSNAVKFTPKYGRVEVRLDRIESHVQIQVSDTGQGISPSFLPYVFDRFRQADSSISRSVGGLGLGMAIVRHLVELHGGTVKAESPGEGQGATFTVCLPIIAIYSPKVSLENNLEEEFATESNAVALQNSLMLKDLEILVVDDEADARELLIAILEQYGASVRTAGTAKDALEEIANSQPNVLISDIGMPQEDGFSLIRQLRLLPAAQGGRIPAVALTAYAREEDRTRVLLAGFQQHLPKPVSPDELAAVVASLTGRTGNEC